MIPKQNIDLSTPVEFEDYPTHTFYVDPTSQQVRGMEDGLKAMQQAVQIIFGVERFFWQIYSPNFGVEFDGLIGSEYGFVTSELKRRIEESFIPDKRILGASAWDFQMVNTDTLICSMTVNTVYGNFETKLEVTL